MILFYENKIERKFELNEFEILRRFMQSEIYKDITRSITVRLALFISFTEPAGLNSSFTTSGFRNLFEQYCINKHEII